MGDSKRQKSVSKQEDKSSKSQLSQRQAEEEVWACVEEILTRQDGVETLVLNAALCLKEHELSYQVKV